MFSMMTSAPAWPGDEVAGADAIALYQGSEYAQVIKVLKDRSSRSTQEALYLGLSYLRSGDQAKAIDAWKEYVHLDPGSEGARSISQSLTLLIREEAKRSAAQIRIQEKSIGKALDSDTVAVSPFRNLGKASNDPLSKGLAEMVITDLSQVKSLKVVERIQFQALLDELKLSQSGLVDPKSAPRVGKLLGAGKIATGSFLDLNAEDLRLDAAISQTEDGKLVTAPEVSGRLAAFYELEKSLVFKMLEGLGRSPESLDSSTRDALERIHTKNFKAFRLYSEGLNFFDQGKYREASQSFFFALEEDPGFDLARKALLITPQGTLDLTAIISSSEAVARMEAMVFGGAVPLEPPAGRGLALQSRAVQRVTLPPIAQQTMPATTRVNVDLTFP